MKTIIILLLLALPAFIFAHSKKSVTDNASVHADTINQSGYTLIFINKEAGFSTDLSQKLQETFFQVYPVLCKKYNPGSTRTVTFVVDPAYDGVAATSGNQVVYSPQWFDKHPNDIDVVTHEVMHIVQAYGHGSGPWWVTEGIADYVRFRFGLDNAKAGWSLPDVTENQNYDNSYRITARFFVWIEQNKNKKFVEKMDKIMRDHKYSDEVWVKLTGKTTAELWEEYQANPTI
ncbi:basic secretory protein-like protein [Gaoshiqia sediminis]|uniref:Basic secretory family protein n=1 Tax=Gaoshiqia sediminis TaxID=2986998 RepID=A0AA41Y6M5_9BACT|nr:basic secretory protein-like protein [Gaoshiqia sediminis]MCW0484401.1 basic secretory family protein [Gaoshiqia sediminis]